VGECTAFAVLPEAPRAGCTLIGQNWDWLLRSFDTVVVLGRSGRRTATSPSSGRAAGKTGLNSSESAW
jgi:hypothetical protein